MSIGLFSLASLFPLSVQRAVKAANLTKGTDLRFNVDGLIDLYPQIITRPDLGGFPNGFPEFYVIDPLGWNFVQASAPGLSYSFGHLNDTAKNNSFVGPNGFLGSVNYGGVDRYPFFGFYGIPSADFLVTLPDSWLHQYDTPVDPAIDLSSRSFIDVPGLAASGFSLPNTVAYRIVLFSKDGVSSQSRTITDVTGDTVRWDEFGDPYLVGNKNGFLDGYPLPGNFYAGMVMIQSQDRRYTWLLTCRKLTNSGSADIDAVIFRNRSGDNPRDQEALYPSAQPWFVGQKQVIVDYSSYPVAPLVKKGGFVFDASNARWYRITSVADNTSLKQIQVGIEVPFAVASPILPNVGYLMFPKAVVDVYPLGVKTAP
ncbi:MAG: hypothetical protein EXS05_16610 [Planctomycetaceae bacterium]|nr:hypothetical protein [Planctomycetaceae bacterium]